MKPRIEIRQNETGEVRTFVDNHDWEEPPDGDREFLWGEGNYSCDCNRELFFLRVKNEDEPLGEESRCGIERFSVRITNSETQELLYQDGSW